MRLQALATITALALCACNGETTPPTTSAPSPAPSSTSAAAPSDQPAPTQVAMAECEPRPLQPRAAMANADGGANGAAAGQPEIESRFLSSLAAPILGFAAEKLFDILMDTVMTTGEATADAAGSAASALASDERNAATGSTDSKPLAIDCKTPSPTLGEPAPPAPAAATMAIATYSQGADGQLQQVSPEGRTFTSGEQILLRITANLPGRHQMINITPDGRSVPLADWQQGAGSIRDIGPFAFGGTTGTDRIAFNFYPCRTTETAANGILPVDPALLATLPGCNEAGIAGRSSLPAARDLLAVESGLNHFTSAPLPELVQDGRTLRALDTELSFHHVAAGG